MTNVQASEFRTELLDSTASPFQPISKPRSIYTYTSSDDQIAYGLQRINDTTMTLDSWCGPGIGCGSPPPYSPTPTASTGSYLWRPPSRYAIRSHPSLTYMPSDESCSFMQDAGSWRDSDPAAVDNLYTGAVIATHHGTMTIRLHSKMRVDMTIDRAIRITNLKSNIVMSLSATGASAALLHPNGRIHQYGSRVEILAHDPTGNNKYAKMWYKGVSFTSDKCALVYLVDSAGTRTTTDTFSDMNQDFSLSVFYNESRHGVGYHQEVMHLLQNAQYFVDDKKVQNWIVNNVRISQTQDGLVRIARNSNKYQLRTSPSNGSATITTPFVHATASLGPSSHLFVRRGERRMHYDCGSFIVRNAGHSAGFDEKNMLKVL